MRVYFSSGGLAYEFIDKMITVAMPRIREFNGFTPLSLSRLKLELRLHDIMAFPEIEAHYDTFLNVAPVDVDVHLANCRWAQGGWEERGLI